MNQALVFSSHSFLGFEVCKQLLDEGIVVHAVSDKRLSEDRELEVGRNANFHFSSSYPIPYRSKESGYVFFPFYDVLYDEEINIKRWQSMMKNKDGFIPGSHFIFLYSSNWLKTNDSNQNRFQMEKFKEELIEDERFKLTVIYLPTLYGPRQPESFIIQKIMNQTDSEGCACIDLIDDLESAILIQDAVKMIVSMKDKEGSFLFHNEKEDIWLEIFQYLEVNEKIRIRSAQKTDKSKLEVIYVENSLSVQEAICQQKEYQLKNRGGFF
ncbi:nucleoside-diphosphate-sugar epimerase [Oikeobacillus pervagus]|uniref:Nucleoside-diphosphate-sugar epimerase n=1 Tax=Oikeobacillus pervagus TaxID=1325931 RepID=A0AAJ1T5M3_9BACI|nr:hypothetical protein [Oikeobacillus pervagus]MDQ0215676.1 nucleoside-diphosphate-sugar epimerase [Oikeobacillus pervagus]